MGLIKSTHRSESWLLYGQINASTLKKTKDLFKYLKYFILKYLKYIFKYLQHLIHWIFVEFPILDGQPLF